MKLTDAAFNALHTVNETGVQTAVEVRGAASMDGKRKTKLQWNVATAPTLAALESVGYVRVERSEPTCPIDAVGKRGHARRMLKITITDAGREALAAN